MKFVAIVSIMLVVLSSFWAPYIAAQHQPEVAHQFAAVSPVREPKRELVTFVNQHYRFSVTYPSHWERIQIHWDDPDGDARSDTATAEPTTLKAPAYA